MIDQAISQEKATNILPSDVPVTKPTARLIPPSNGTNVPTRRFGENSAGNQPTVRPAAPQAMSKANQPKAHSVLTKSTTPKPAKVAPTRTAKVPPIISAPTKTMTANKVSAVKPKESAVKPMVSAAKPKSNTVPPIVQGTSSQKSSAKTPPIVRGRKIDPSATISRNEIPLPMAVRSSFDTRSAAWPVNRR